MRRPDPCATGKRFDENADAVQPAILDSANYFLVRYIHLRERKMEKLVLSVCMLGISNLFSEEAVERHCLPSSRPSGGNSPS
jgi:hypothetical protein